MRSGFVSIIGQPNVGKSTLLNTLMGLKLAAVSPKAQTTRQTIRGILTEPQGQLVFLDTPGFHRPKDSLGKFMIQEVSKTFLDADLFYFMVEPILPQALDAALLDWLTKESQRAADKWKPGRMKSEKTIPPVAYSQLYQSETGFLILSCFEDWYIPIQRIRD